VGGGGPHVVGGGGGGPKVVVGVVVVGRPLVGVGSGRQSKSSWHCGMADAMSCAVSEMATAAMPVQIATVMRPMVLVLDIWASSNTDVH
jgi:hypothetical protein